MVIIRGMYMYIYWPVQKNMRRAPVLGLAEVGHLGRKLDEDRRVGRRQVQPLPAGRDADERDAAVAVGPVLRVRVGR